MKRNRRDLVRVGVFVVVAGAVLLGALAWIAGSSVFRSIDTYVILFESSVSGLNSGANVQYQGVVVGRVRDLGLTGDIPPKVEVTVDLDPGTPVRRDTRAALVGSLVTGIKFIELQGGSAIADPLPRGGVIPGNVSSLDEIQGKATEVADRAIDVIRRLDDKVFTPENAEALRRFVEDLSAIVRSLRNATQGFGDENVGKDVARLLDEVTQVAERANEILADFTSRRGEIYGELVSTLRQTNEAIGEMRELVQGARDELRGTGSSITELVSELTRAIERLEETLEVVQSDPSLLIRGRKVREREFDR